VHYSLGIIIPVILVAISRVRMHPPGLFYAALAAVMGLILNRMNVAITGMAAKLGSYFPSWEEIPAASCWGSRICGVCMRDQESACLWSFAVDRHSGGGANNGNGTCGSPRRVAAS